MTFLANDLVQIEDDIDLEDPPLTSDEKEFVKPFRGRVGRITSLETRGRTGESRTDPLYTVKVPVLGEWQFWGDELKLLSRTAPAPPRAGKYH